jgi:hypothetical protein
LIIAKTAIHQTVAVNTLEQEHLKDQLPGENQAGLTGLSGMLLAGLLRAGFVL